MKEGRRRRLLLFAPGCVEVNDFGRRQTFLPHSWRKEKSSARSMSSSITSAKRGAFRRPIE
ncbi:MAG: hypothetical protein WC483_02135 [Candidatus Paceibacterota bacterium]